jgi:hypothetical protein
MKDVLKDELKDIQKLIQPALSDITLTQKIQLRIIAPL